MADRPNPFAYRDYRSYWLARLTNTIAQTVMVVVIGWQVYDLARRTMSPRDAALQLGLIGMVQFVPLAALTLVVGWVADRIDRRRIAQVCIFLEGLCAGVLGWLTYHQTIGLPALFVVAGMLGVTRAFANPALQALAPNLVPKAVLPSAIAGSLVAWQVGAIGGPAIGGYLYAGNPWWPYAAAGALFLIGLGGLLFIRPVPLPKVAPAHPVRQMVEGLQYVWRNPIVLGAISLDLFAVLFGGATAMLPIYARDILKVGAEGLGHLRAAPAAGSALIAITLGYRPLKTNVGLKMFAAVALFGAMTIVFGLSTWLPLSLAALFVLGAADMVSVYVRQSLIQLHTPDAMRGRVGAVSSLFVSGSNELGEAESGIAARLIGPVPAVVAGGIGAVLITIAWMRLFPSLRNARTFAPPVSSDPIQPLEAREAQA